MDIDKLIKQLRRFGGELGATPLNNVIGKYMLQAVDALEELQAELEQAKEERDVAVEYLRGQCRYCKRNLVCTSRKGPHSNCWEWRGQREN